MNIHEYQAKELFRAMGLVVPPGDVADTVDGALALAREYGLPVMVKSQVLTGGRGKAGGVKFCDTEDDVREHAGNILGMDIKGHTVRKVLITPAETIAEEFYVGMLVDRGSRRVLLMASAEGGVEIEQVAKENPAAILKFAIDPRYGLLDHQALGIAMQMTSDIKKARQLAVGMQKLYRAFMHSDASLAEINPYIFTDEGVGKAIDAKVNLDDNALYRHPNYEAMRDLDEEDESERLAREADLSFVKLDGNVGCLVNGAGLAMATMDIIKAAGAEPANFLDIKGGAKQENVVNAFTILLSDSHVKAVLINIFGGIVKCDMVARGIAEAMKSVEVEVPVVVRLEGTNATEGRQILADSDFPFITAQGLKDAADKVVAALGT